MAGSRALGVGIVGLSAGGGWAAGAHAAAIDAVDGLELRGLVGSSAGATAAAVAKYGVPGADSVEELAARDDIDLVAVVVKTPLHRELLLPAIQAGSSVFTEWPVARNLAEAEELAAATAGVRSFAGLQGRSAPGIRYLRDLVADGYVGAVRSTDLVAAAGGWGGQTALGREWLLDVELGATMLTISFGHSLDCVTTVLGGFDRLTATTATQRREATVAETGATVPVTAEDQVAVVGTLGSGAVASLHMRGGTDHGTAFRWEVHGTEGDLVITLAGGGLHFGNVVVHGARGAEELAELPVPDAYDEFPQLRGQPAHAVAHAYARIRDDLVTGSTTAPSFAEALELHRVLDGIQRGGLGG